MSRIGMAQKAWLLLLGLVVSATPAHGHLMNSGFGPFYDGFSHPLVSPEDLFPVAAMTLLAGLAGARYGRWLLSTLPVAWTIAMSAAWAISLPILPSWATAATTVLVGVAVAADVRLPLAAFMGLAATVGTLHGLANGVDLTAKPSGLVAIAGTAYIGLLMLGWSTRA